MRRALKILGWIIGALVAIPILLVIGVLVFANIDPGRRFIETMTPKLTGGMVRITGLGGKFPDALRAGKISVADEKGVWLSIDELVLDWTPRDLLRYEVSIDQVTAARVTVDRLPVASQSSSTSSSAGSQTSIPRINLARLHVGAIDIAPAIAGRAISLGVDGSGDLTSLETGTAHLVATSLDPNRPPDRYTVEAAADQTQVHATIDVAEGPNGLIAGLAQLPDLGAVSINASADGPLNALATKAKIAAGELRATLDGTVDTAGQSADLSFDVTSPAMSPAPGIGWSNIRLEGKMHGPFVSPQATGVLSADGLTAAGAGIGSLRANLAGDASGKAELHAQVDGIHVPGPTPEILAGGPLTLDATAQLLAASPSVQFSLRQVLLSAEGTASETGAKVHLVLPDLAPFAAIGGVKILGRTALDIDVTRSKDVIDASLKGDIGITGGMDPVPGLIGNAATIDLAASVKGQDVTVSRFSLTGSTLQATAKGQFANQQLDTDYSFALTDLGAIRPGASGTIAASGHIAGPVTALTVTSDITGNAAAEGGQVDQFTAHLNLAGLPGAPAGDITAGGTVLGAPLAVSINAAQRDQGFHVVINRTTWKSLMADGTLDLAAGQTIPTGKITLSMSRLADLAPLIGKPIAGSVKASLDASSDAARISAVVEGASVPNTASVGKADLKATITDPTGHPAVDGTLALDGVEASGIRASGRVAAKGPLDAVALTVTAQSPDLHGQPLRLDTSGTLNVTGKSLLLAALRTDWGKETVRLLAPARIGFAQGATVDKLALSFHQAELTASGSYGANGALDVTAALRNLPADVAAIVAPAYAADGMISAEARVTGSAARPEGNLRLTATGVRQRSGPGRGLPMANLTVAATLMGTSAQIDSKLTAGKSNVTVTGSLPVNPAGRMDLRAGGAIDLAMLNPLVAAQGRRLKGSVDLAIGVAGTPTAPQASGTVRISGGDIQDASFDTHISDITALVRADGDTIRIERFDAKAGAGTLALGGTVRLPRDATGAVAVDLTAKANRAKVLSSDLITAIIDADLSIRGETTGTLTLGGTLLARETDIQVPDKLPPSIAVLKVRNAGSPLPKPPPPSPAMDIALNFTLNAPEAVYIRGHGLDVELGGKIVFGGTAARPLPQGGLKLRRGTISLAGTSLTLTEGTVDFTGGGLANPSLKLVATSTSATVVATLTVSGDVRNLKITLSSVPDLPQDEILSQLLFNTTKSRLSPFQVAEIASALAEISGVGGGGDPLGSLRSALGLDQLSVGTNASGAAAVQAGRYIAPGVRVGASQSASGGQTQATVQIDITKGLKLETTVGSGTSASAPTPGVSNGTSVGLTYQFEY